MRSQVGTQGALVPLQRQRKTHPLRWLQEVAFLILAIARHVLASHGGAKDACTRNTVVLPCKSRTSVRAASQVQEGSEKAKHSTGVRRRTHIAVWPAPAICAGCWERWLLAHAVRGAWRCLPVPIALCVPQTVSACQAGDIHFQGRAHSLCSLQMYLHPRWQRSLPEQGSAPNTCYETACSVMAAFEAGFTYRATIAKRWRVCRVPCHCVGKARVSLGASQGLLK